MADPQPAWEWSADDAIKFKRLCEGRGAEKYWGQQQPWFRRKLRTALAEISRLTAALAEAQEEARLNLSAASSQAEECRRLQAEAANARRVALEEVQGLCHGGTVEIAKKIRALLESDGGRGR